MKGWLSLKTRANPLFSPVERQTGGGAVFAHP